MKKHVSILAMMAVLLLAALAASPAYGAAPGQDVRQGNGEDRVRVIVVLHDNEDATEAAEEADRDNEVEVGQVYRQAFRGYSADISSRRLERLKQDPRVASVEPDYQVWALAQPVPTGVDRVDTDLNTTANIDGVDDRVDVDIAILDTGIDQDHPDLNLFFHVDCARRKGGSPRPCRGRPCESYTRGEPSAIPDGSK